MKHFASELERAPWRAEDRDVVFDPAHSGVPLGLADIATMIDTFRVLNEVHHVAALMT